jgi:cytochrome c oxidase subunit I+III
VTLVIAGHSWLAVQRSAKADYGPMPVGRGVSVPPHTEVLDAPRGWR